LGEVTGHVAVVSFIKHQQADVAHLRQQQQQQQQQQDLQGWPPLQWCDSLNPSQLMLQEQHNQRQGKVHAD
jgi:hypothetical protein